MAENLFCDGQKVVTPSMMDGWYRTFRGYPEMSDHAKGMLKKWCDAGEYAKMLLFFIGKCEFSEDYSYFLIREFIKGWI